MNRQQRHARVRALTAFIERMGAEGQGVWQIEILKPHERMAAFAAALGGDRRWQAVFDQLQTLATSDPAVLCLFCPAEFSTEHLPHLLVLFGAHGVRPTGNLMNGICAACAAKLPSDAMLQNAVTDYYRKNLIPDIRAIEVRPNAGHG